MTYRSTSRFLLEGLEGITVFLLVMITWPLSRRWLNNWGSKTYERQRKWVGDTFVAVAKETYTRAIDIDASPEVVWQWVVQFGLGRAGFYSYEILERLAGIPVRNVESIVAEYQSLEIGDEIKLHPKAPGIPVGALKVARHVCFGKSGPIQETSPDPNRSWSIYLEPRSDRLCRLILRGCIDSLRKPTLFKRVILAIDTPIDFVMEQRMLRTIRRLAESGGS